MGGVRIATQVRRLGIDTAQATDCDEHLQQVWSVGVGSIASLASIVGQVGVGALYELALFERAPP